MAAQYKDGTTGTYNGQPVTYRVSADPITHQESGKWVVDSGPGAPLLPRGAGVPNPSSEALYKDDSIKQNAAVAAAEKNAGRLRNMEGAEQRLQQRGGSTGGLRAAPIIGGIARFFDPDLQIIRAEQAASAREHRVPGEGAISDYDAKQFLSMTAGTDKRPEANRVLIAGSRVAEDAALQKNAMFNWWHNTYGNTDGFNEAWGRYAQENPIFDPESESSGAPRLNPKRATWRSYFGAVRTPQDARPSQIETDAIASFNRASRATAGNPSNPQSRKFTLTSGQKLAEALGVSKPAGPTDAQLQAIYDQAHR